MEGISVMSHPPHPVLGSPVPERLERGKQKAMKTAGGLGHLTQEEVERAGSGRPGEGKAQQRSYLGGSCRDRAKLFPSVHLNIRKHFFSP